LDDSITYLKVMITHESTLVTTTLVLDEVTLSDVLHEDRDLSRRLGCGT
jgi:hypothetical protein